MDVTHQLDLLPPTGGVESAGLPVRVPRSCPPSLYAQPIVAGTRQPRYYTGARDGGAQWRLPARRD